VRGHGYTDVNGVKKRWKEGDLIMLPVVPGGVEHQHFNEDENESSIWIGYVYAPFGYALGSMMGQVEDSKEWGGFL